MPTRRAKPTLAPAATAALAVAAVFCIATLLAAADDPPAPVHAPAPAPAPAPNLPALFTPAELKAEKDCALQLEADLNTGKAALFEKQLDLAALQARALEGVKLSDKETAAEIKAIHDDMNWPDRLRQMVTVQHNQFKLLRIRTLDNDRRWLFRLLQDDGAFSYIDFIVGPAPAPGPAGGPGPGLEQTGPRILDLYLYNQGDTVSQTIRRAWLPGLIANNPARKQLLPEIDRATIDAAPAIAKLLQTIKAANWDLAAEYYAALPEAVRNLKPHLLYNLLIASQGKPGDFDAACRAFNKKYPNDPAADLLAVDLCTRDKKYADVIKALDRIDLAVGPDANLNVVRARMSILAKDYRSARRFAEQAIKAEPTLAYAYPVLFSITLHDEDYKATLQYMTQYESATGKKLGPLDDNPIFEDFIGTEEYDQWTAKHKAK